MAADTPGACLHRPLVQYETALRRLLGRLKQRVKCVKPEESDLLKVADQHEQDLYLSYKGHISALRRALKPAPTCLVLR